MARTWFVVGIFALAATLGIVGYQGLTYYFYGAWPPVSTGFVWSSVFGPIAPVGWTWIDYLIGWIAGLPLVVWGLVLSYGLFLASDLFRGRDARNLR
jgi:hypothetical protein